MRNIWICWLLSSLTVLAADVSTLEQKGAKVRKNADGQVVVVDGRGTELTGAELENLPELKDLKLSGPQVTDATLARLGTFTHLTSLALDKTSITDETLKNQVAKLPKLQQLFLAQTAVTDAGVAALPLGQYTRLRLAGTKITDATLSGLKNATNLQTLDVSNTGVTSAGVATLAGIATLSDLNLYSTSVDDAACESLGKKTSLTQLNLDDTNITDAGVNRLGGLNQLAFLHLGRTVVSDACLETLCGLKTLKTVHVTRTNITPAGADRLAGALPECDVVRTLKTDWLPSHALSGKPVQLIYDTDMGNDIDDAFALSIIHTLISQGKCELLGITLTKSNLNAARYCKAYNTVYGRPDIPIGLVPNGPAPEDGRYVGKVLEMKNADGSPRYPYPADFVPEDSVRLLRRLLAQAEDHSVVIAQVGFSTNLARLLDTPADDLSPLTGRELAEKKVCLVSAMAGGFLNYSHHKEYNVVTDIPSAQKVFHEWPGEIVFSGFEIGIDIHITKEDVEKNFPADHILRRSFDLYCTWGKASTWDLTSVLFAVECEGERDYYTLTSFGNVMVADDSTTTFTPDKRGHRRLFVMTPEQKKRVAEQLLLRTTGK
ncbi:MAG: nucleoside hydrolase [Planctomycetia bacterium]|nr:nucleoside hydrolase [Planctomycetia bacterium]